MNSKTCQTCGQALPQIRFGVLLPPLKARIFDMVKRGGVGGVESLFLRETFGGNTLKTHIHQINELIDESGFRIYGRGGTYRLEKRRV
jgi:hypothetical protein